MKTMGKGYFESMCFYMNIINVHEYHAYDKSNKIKLNMWMWEPFHNKSGVIVSSENVWTNNNVQMHNIL